MIKRLLAASGLAMLISGGPTTPNVPWPTGGSSGRMMARWLSVIYIPGPLFGLLTIFIAQPKNASWSYILIVVFVAVSFGVVLASGRLDQMPQPFFEAVIYMGTLAVSVGLYYSGRPGAGIPFFYLWATPYAFYFFRLRRALLQAAFMALCFAVVAAVQLRFSPDYGTLQQHGSRWLIVVGTMLVVGLLVARLSDSLRQSQSILERGFVDSLAGVALISPTGRWLMVNESMARMAGRSASEMVGMTVSEVTHPDDRGSTEAALEAALDGSVPRATFRKRYLKPDGTSVWVERTFSLISDEQGRPLYFFTQAIDVSARKEAEDALESSESRIRTIFEHLPLGMTFSDPRGTIIETNDAADAMLGYTSAEMRGYSSRRFIYPEDLAAFDGQLAVLLSRPEVPAKIEVRVVRKDGQVRHAALTVVGVFDPDHKLIGRIGIADDVTERNQAEVELAESRRWLATIRANAPIISFSLDKNGNPTMVEGNVMAKYQLNSLKTLEGIAAVEPEAAQFIHEAMTGIPQSKLIHLQRTDVELEAVSVPVFDPNGRFNGVVGIAVDVTERRRAEAAQRESEAKSRFLASMSHELRNPVNVVLGFAQLLDRESPGPLNGRQRHYIDLIKQGGAQMLVLLNDLLDLSKVAAGRMEVTDERFDLCHVVKQCVEEMGPIAASRGVSLRVEARTNTFARGDPRRVTQVILNLLSNAIKFTPRNGAVTVVVSRQPKSASVVVNDTGIGIAPEDLDRVFDEFTQIESAHGGSQIGTGLGLPLSRHLAVLMGGGLTACSTLGAGSNFTLLLRLGGTKNRPLKQAVAGVL